MNKWKIWFQAVRSFSFTASIVPVCLGLAIAFHAQAAISWSIFFAFLFSTVFIHTATNLTNDYYDYRKGLDREDTFGSSGVLVDEILKPKDFLGAILFFIMMACLLGLFIIFSRGVELLYLGVLGILGGLFYTAQPIAYKYRALGDFFVFILMGILLVVGSNYAITGIFQKKVILISLPISLLVTAIIHANNTRDIVSDREMNIRTLAMMLGYEKSKVYYTLLVSLPYVGVLLLCMFKILPYWSLLVGLTFPVALKNMKLINKSSKKSVASIAHLDVMSAQLHLIFGGVMILSLVLGGIFL